MRRFLVDTNVFLYALGTDHPYREPCRRIVGAVQAGALRPDASVELVQEVLWVLSRRTGARGAAVAAARDVAAVCRLHAFDVDDLRVALDLHTAHEMLTARDAVHAATALNRGIGTIVTADRDFDALAGLERIDPADTAAVDALAT